MLYQYLSGENWRNIYIVGDLHGCRQLLNEQLVALGFDTQEDLLISVGDLIDRGPDSQACLALLNEPWFRCVRGNHEEMALNALASGSHKQWMFNGGDWFYELEGVPMMEAKHALNRCRDLPLILHLQLEDRIIVIAHADYPAAHYAWGAEVDETQIVWSRSRIERLQKGKGQTITGADAFYFGHTPLTEPLVAYNQYYIDTGAVYGNRLTLVKVQ
ncbi:serine/threonine protein phosphatase [Erwinia typographi]|uniref:Serine/threonine protein phosphatase n=1 Tax=Erwinia typographi TaxID=371042 RepID=A0A0A3ZA32_9GAMM|nr:metallophosphoesterase [Erwinia typographi]KGT95745.1 serine/threonine protein phosphatase [Erwinia typographi]